MSIKIASMNFGDCDTILHNTPNGMKNITEVLGPNGEVYWSAIKELTGIPPLSIRSNGTMLLDYLISGNMSQTGTPTPDNPIQPQETGGMTGNLANLYGVDKTSLSLNLKTGDNMTIVINGTKTAGANVIGVAYPNITLPAGTYTVRIKMIGGTISNITGGALFGINASTYELRTTPQINKVGDISKRTFTLTEDTLLTSLDIAPSYGDVGSVWDNATFECWLYSGSGDIPYEPYGYKLPITSTDQTNNIYLGEVPTTRRIKKYEFTGSETWSAGTENYYSFVPQTYGDGVPYSAIICSHCSNATINNIGKAVFFKKTDFPDITTGEELKQYCSDQYANDTPVTVWYVLAEPTTGIVNEPLRKIGDYADTVSYEQAGVQIPTNRGNTVIDVLTELKPSQMYIKYK